VEHFSKGNDLVSILLVEDDTLLNQQLTALLQAQGYIVTNESCGDRALKVIKK
jgi:DNA-binding response OmpR family regulator